MLSTCRVSLRGSLFAFSSRRSCLVLYGLLLFCVGMLAACGKATHNTPSPASDKIAAFEGHRALYVALDVKSRAQAVAQEHVYNTNGRATSRLAAGPLPNDPSPQEAARYDSLCAPYLGLTDDALLDAVYDATRDHYVLGYRRARDHMYGLDEPVIDIFDDVIEDMYTGRRVTPDGTRTPENTNTEHSWPRSKGTAAGPAQSDLHHLFVVDAYSNSRRQNFEFGIPRCGDSGQPTCRWVSENHGHDAQPSRIGLNTNGDPIFEVRSSRKGDVARAQFYISSRYHLPIEERTEKVLRQWHTEDPPDARERERNRRIELVQNNRNPFVDCPEIVDAIKRFGATHAP